MQTDTVREFLLTCHAAKRVLSLQPELPQGIGPRDLRILESVAELSRGRDHVRVSDVSEEMGVSRPGVTRDISRLEKGGYLRKEPSPQDRRTVFVSLTEEGARIEGAYVVRHHQRLADILSGFDDAELGRAIALFGSACETVGASYARGGEDR